MKLFCRFFGHQWVVTSQFGRIKIRQCRFCGKQDTIRV